jgi:hypothetical protein
VIVVRASPRSHLLSHIDVSKKRHILNKDFAQFSPARFGEAFATLITLKRDHL